MTRQRALNIVVVSSGNSGPHPIVAAAMDAASDSLHRFHACPSAEEAVRSVSGRSVDAVCIDLSGFLRPMEALGSVSQAAPDVPIVLFLDREDDAIVREASRFGADDYLAYGELQGASLRRALRYAMDRRRMRRELEQVTSVDPITKLPNRAAFLRTLQRALARSELSGGQLSVLLLDLDRFKGINDTLGHDVGDSLLRVVAARLEETAGLLVARLGGDEFAVLVEAPQTAAREIAKTLLEAIERPFSVSGQECRLTASIGVSSFPGECGDARCLLKNADIALYLAKGQGGNRWRHAPVADSVRPSERLSMEAALSRALIRGEFHLHYQPVVEVRTGRVSGAEALIRWQHPEKGWVAPAQFIPLAEESGLIVPMGEWVIRQACRQAGMWQASGMPDLRMAVNLSARQFSEEGVARFVDEMMKESGIAPDTLELEITETTVARNPEQAVELLGALKAMGVRLAVDDFGMGYSSLSYLKRFPLHVLKIDRSFIQYLPEDAHDASITQAIIAMAHALELSVVAEGVEKESQITLLNRLGCDEMQGYYISKPVPPERFPQVVRGLSGRLLSPGGRFEKAV